MDLSCSVISCTCGPEAGVQPEAAVLDDVPAQRKAQDGVHGFTENSSRKEGSRST